MMQKKNQKAKCSGLQWAYDCLRGLKRKRHKIKGDWDELAKNPLMLKLVFSFEILELQF